VEREVRLFTIAIHIDLPPIVADALDLAVVKQPRESRESPQDLLILLKRGTVFAASLSLNKNCVYELYTGDGFRPSEMAVMHIT